MRRLPRTLAVTCWVNWNGPGLTNFPNRRVLYERATSRAEVEAHRVHGYSLAEIARYLGLHYSTVSRVAQAGDAPIQDLTPA